jgi:hypothetical protein
MATLTHKILGLLNEKYPNENNAELAKSIVKTTLDYLWREKKLPVKENKKPTPNV